LPETDGPLVGYAILFADLLSFDLTSRNILTATAIDLSRSAAKHTARNCDSEANRE
jgi:hypothetical protein